MGGSGGVRLVVVWLVLLCLFGGCLGYFAKWDIEYMFWSPDCVENIVMGINGEFPGPTIRAKAGETIHISLTNKLHTEGVVIHWHGIRQHGTPWADGTASISQCTINPGESFIYRFTVDKAGTYFYHGHYGMQRSAGLYGLLIVDVAEGETEPFHYDDELNILLSDWWHQSSQHQEVRLSSNPMRWIGEPQTLLINGRGQYKCSIAPEYSKTPISKCQLKGGEHCAPPILKVLPNKAYRLRIASTTALASLHFAIAGHKMVVVEADGNYVQPFETDDLYIYSGESYSVLITTNQKPENYWISVSQIARKSDTSRALTVLNYQDIDISKSPTLPPFNAPTWDDFESFKKFSDQILAHMNNRKPPNKYDTQIFLVNTQNKINGYTKWFISNVSLVLPTTPYLGSLKYDLTDPNEKLKMEQPPQSPTLGAGLYMLDYKSTVDVILQNAHMAEEGVSEIHPWHLHGHDFWVLGYGNGKFEKGDEKNFNLINPPYRNTAVLFPHGWTALRFVADNPGVWAFHCHIEPHLHLGMGVVFAEGVEQVDGNAIPNKALACGLFAEKFMHLNKH